MHIQSFHFLCVRSPVQTERRASMRQAQAGKQEREFKGVQQEILTVRGKPGAYGSAALSEESK